MGVVVEALPLTIRELFFTFVLATFHGSGKNVCKSLTEVIAFNGLLNATPTNSSHILLIAQ